MKNGSRDAFAGGVYTDVDGPGTKKRQLLKGLSRSERRRFRQAIWFTGILGQQRSQRPIAGESGDGRVHFPISTS